ncbi:DUF6876 family protein [Botrimarina hoheduenensis]|uniref:DUF6876 domain-containing protein n=1 Tax=Botrimarina hoheduenensis TaxID=2528000 RepID=A0A5C5VV15_9BACT|nr:DUF6876 family protein [Botrimarina hoheduenensis]TWT41362.1 hypothetical protein Pla111_30760 [Botrimarina hoheduenensis]
MSQDQQMAAQLRNELQHFTGDLERYRHPINRKVIYTPGVKHVAERAGAYWLIDAIASWIGSHSFNEALNKDDRIAGLHRWRLEVAADVSATLQALIEGAEPPYAPMAFITQRIPFTDFPLESIEIWAGFDGQH